jgi:hypothetical protein
MKSIVPFLITIYKTVLRAIKISTHFKINVFKKDLQSKKF